MILVQILPDLTIKIIVIMAFNTEYLKYIINFLSVLSPGYHSFLAVLICCIQPVYRFCIQTVYCIQHLLYTQVKLLRKHDYITHGNKKVII